MALIFDHACVHSFTEDILMKDYQVPDPVLGVGNREANEDKVYLSQVRQQASEKIMQC